MSEDELKKKILLLTEEAAESVVSEAQAQAEPQAEAEEQEQEQAKEEWMFKDGEG